MKNKYGHHTCDGVTVAVILGDGIHEGDLVWRQASLGVLTVTWRLGGVVTDRSRWTGTVAQYTHTAAAEKHQSQRQRRQHTSS